VIHEVMADFDTDKAEIFLLIHWVGGVHTEIRLPRRRRGQRTSADVIAAARQLVLIANDDLIAGILNMNGLVTGYGNRWTRERVTSLRSYHGIPSTSRLTTESNRGLTSTMPRGFFRWRLKNSGLRRKLVRSRHTTLCRTVPGSSAVRFCPRKYRRSRGSHIQPGGRRRMC
jgi:hypothetical protein